MTITHARITNLIIIIILSASGHIVYGWYLAAMHFSLEVLNRQQLYLGHAYRFYNSIFVLYEMVLLARMRTFFFAENMEWLINCAEHLCFGIIICIKIYIYTAIFGNKQHLSRRKRGIIAFALFNLVGVFNEVFQNNLASRSLLVFIPDSIKDMQVNLVGAFVFALAVWCRIYHLKYKPVVNS